MATQAQINANRANAEKSTGPKTPEGKAKVSGNAVKHGLGSKKLLVGDNQRQEFETLRQDLLKQVQPEGTVEEILFKELLHAAWNLERVRHLEDQLFFHCADRLADPGFDQKLDMYTRFHARFERTFHRTLKELKSMQTESSVSTTYTQMTKHKPPALVNMGEVNKQTQNWRHPEPDMGVLEEWMAQAGVVPEVGEGLHPSVKAAMAAAEASIASKKA